jgi:hypothetical protein
MIVGFTGTQKGMTGTQYVALVELLRELNPEEAHHGDCIGADDEFHIAATMLKIPVVTHPPTNPKKRAFNSGYIVWPEKPYLIRNQDIVMSCDTLIATPSGDREKRRSGTWSTVRAARKLGKRVMIIYPDGDIQS